MQQTHVSPLPPQEGRRARLAVPASDTTKELRWHLLDLVRICRHRLKLRDRDIAVLRGLLTLLPPGARADQRVIFASNRVLIARCDGMDERTLRRRLVHLASVGLLARQLSPNGKRYQIRDQDGHAPLTYGIDLAPLFQIEPHLEALAANCQQEALHCKALRAMIRDRLFHNPESGSADLREEARLALRRNLESGALGSILARLDQVCVDASAETPHIESTNPCYLTASDSQNDRHIQRSDKDLYESERTSEKSEAAISSHSDANQPDISLQECLDLVPTVKAMATALPRCWAELITLAQSLAPAIGLTRASINTAEQHLGKYGFSIAVLGLVEAFERIRSPGAYLHALVTRAKLQSLDLIRMFRSLVRPVTSRRVVA